MVLRLIVWRHHGKSLWLLAASTRHAPRGACHELPSGADIGLLLRLHNCMPAGRILCSMWRWWRR